MHFRFNVWRPGARRARSRHAPQPLDPRWSDWQAKSDLL